MNDAFGRRGGALMIFLAGKRLRARESEHRTILDVGEDGSQHLVPPIYVGPSPTHLHFSACVVELLLLFQFSPRLRPWSPPCPQFSKGYPTLVFIHACSICQVEST